MPLYFACGIDILLALRYAKVITTEGCGKNGSSVAVRELFHNLLTIYSDNLFIKYI